MRTATLPTPAGARRRLRALFACGWGAGAIEQQGGLAAARTEYLLAPACTHLPTADECRQIGVIYECLWDQPPPGRTEEEARAKAAAMARASRSKHWAPPMAWDDDQIDEPGGRPADGWRRTTPRRRAADVVEDAEFVRAHGREDASDAEIAWRLGITKNHLQTACRRVRDRQAGFEAAS
jgi:hypothetical protein